MKGLMNKFGGCANDARSHPAHPPESSRRFVGHGISQSMIVVKA